MPPKSSKKKKSSLPENHSKPSRGPDLPAGAQTDILRVMLELVSHTAKGSTICPSQVPRALHASDKLKYRDWRSMMPRVREVAWGEVQKGRLEITQGGEVRAWEERNDIKGPIRLRKGPKWDDVGADDEKAQGKETE